MRFPENNYDIVYKNLLIWGVGRRAYSAKNLLKPAVEKPQASISVPGAGKDRGESREWLTKKQLLVRLNFGKTIFNELLKRGKIPRRKYSRKLVRYDPVEVEAALSAFDKGVES
jgi:hypothetical protein